MTNRQVLAGLGLMLAIVMPWASANADSCETPVGTLASVQGTVEVMSTAAPQQWRGGKLGDSLCQGDTLRVGPQGRAAVTLINDAVLRIDQNTTLRLIDIPIEQQERSWLELLKGAIQSFSRKPRLLTINTPYLNGSIEGTEFVFRVTENTTQLTVFEGTVVAANDQGSVAVPGGSAVAASKGQAPQQRILVKPRDEAQWALYYPPVLVADSAGPAGDESDVTRAAQLLDVGRIDEARELVERALATDSTAGKAYALRTVVDVVQNRVQDALANGQKAHDLDNTAAGAIALSYAYQANFQISAARDVLASAVEKYSQDALLWARLAELQLMVGEHSAAIAAANKAVTLAPELGRGQLVLGFAALAQFDNGQARTAFDRAMALDSADPLAHLGLGLVNISDGESKAGRRELELAVALDGSNALLRAYLGKAYFTEKRAPLDAQQFLIAKELDPNDPTAFLYDGIRKQTTNDPVSALADLQQSMALNDNRAVYRSRLLLDKDRAARGASLAGAYNDLGFGEQGLAEASRSIIVDPTNAAAHRFLADTYQTQRRREIAKVSELLQSQMLQEVSVAPVQPSSSDANLNIVTPGGPASAGFNEFTPLFQRNQMQGAASLLSGNHDTTGAEAGLSGQWDRYSVSLGALTYDTEGWRPNNVLKQDLYTLFAQAALTPQLNIQAEYRHRESTEGDLAFNFDPQQFLTDKTTDRKQNMARFGLRYVLGPQSTWLLSYIDSQRDENVHEVQELPPAAGVTTFTNDQKVDQKSRQAEVQFLHSRGTTHVVAGAAWSKSDRVDDVAVSVDDTIIGNLFADAGQEKFPGKDPRGYVYVTAQPQARFTWTLGASYERFEQSAFKDTNFNPKLGLQWDATDNMRVRAAGFQTVKPALVGNRSLEPTQIAGFNQLFDDINGTKSDRYGLGVDWHASGSVTTGIELTQRKLVEPIFDPSAAVWITEKRKEQLHSLYADWTPQPRLAVHGKLVYDKYHSDSGIATADDNLPEEVVTWSLPLTVNYFHPRGLFAGLTATHVDQSVRRSATATQASGDEQFITVDAAIGYRLPKRHGVISLGVNNLFDEDFHYQDDSYREFRDEPSIGPYFPVRTVLAHIVLSF